MRGSEARHAVGKTGPAARDEHERLHHLLLSEVARRFRAARREAGLSLRQAAERAGIAASTVHKIETGRIVPSLAICIRLADALDRPISYFVESSAPPARDVRFVARGQGRSTHAPGSLLHFEQVAEPLVSPRMEAFVVTVEPGGKSGTGVPIRYRGEEIVFGLEGQVRFVVRGTPYVVGPGDTLHLKGNVPHTWENPGPSTARMLMVCAFAYGRERDT